MCQTCVGVHFYTYKRTLVVQISFKKNIYKKTQAVHCTAAVHTRIKKKKRMRNERVCGNTRLHVTTGM